MSNLKTGDRVKVIAYADQLGRDVYIGREGIVNSFISPWYEVLLDGAEVDLLFAPDELEKLPNQTEFAVVNNFIHSAPAADPFVTAKVSDPQQSLNDDLLAIAGYHGATVTIRYVKANGDIADREFEPTFRTKNKHGDVVYGGHDTDRDDVRAFRLDRISGSVKVSL